MTSDILRPIEGIENRSPEEVFSIMCARIRATPAPVVAWQGEIRLSQTTIAKRFCAQEGKIWGESSYRQQGRWMTEAAAFIRALTAQPVAQEAPKYREAPTHHVHRGAESLPCHCWADHDHAIGNEVRNPTTPAPVGAGLREALERHLHDIINCGSCSGSRHSARQALTALRAQSASVGGEVKG